MSDPKDFVIENGVLKEYKGPGGDVVIPEGVTSIGDKAFFWCGGLTSVTIPDSVTSIGDWAFRWCSSLTSVTIPESVTSIGESVFAGCSGLLELIVPAKLKSLGKDTFFGNLPEGLVPRLGAFYFALSDGTLKESVLNKTVWSKLDTEMRATLFLQRHGKSLVEVYRKLMDAESAEQILLALLDRLTGKASVGDCGTAALFLTTFFEVVEGEKLRALYDRLKKEKNGAKALKTAEEHVSLMEKLGAAVTVDESLSPVTQKVMAFLIAEKKNAKDLEEKLKKYYSLSFKELPLLLSAEEKECEPLVTAWLLMAHERLKEYSYGQPDVEADYAHPGLCPEAAEIVSMLDPAGLQKALKQLADNYLVAYQNTKKKFLAYPICRYADEANMAELTKRAPKWATSVSGMDAPPLRQLRDAVKYSNTHAAMLFAERYHELDKYAAIRGMTEDELRDKYLSDVGLDEQGGKTYDLGNQTVTVRLQKDMSFLFELPGGKTAKSLPKKNADPEKYEASKADFDEMRKAVKKIVKSRSDVLFRDFLIGNERAAGDWMEAYLKNPLLRGVAELLVWEQRGKTFTLSDCGPINSASQSYAITDQPIKVAHPMDMEPAEATAWQKYFSSRGLKQPFLQVWEPVIDPASIREDRYEGSVQLMYRFAGMEKHGIHSENLHAYSETGFWLDDCALDYRPSTWRINYDGAKNETYTLGKFRFPSYTRKVNHIVSLLDKWTVEDRVNKDDVSVMTLMDSFTLAQITEFIAAAQESQAVNVLALLLEFKNTHFADFDPMDEFTLE